MVNKMVKKDKLILFDLDGTIIYSKDAIFGAINTALEKEGYEPFREEELLVNICTPLEDKFRKRTGGDPEPLMEIFREEYIRIFKDSTYVIPDMIPLLERIRKNGVPCALVTLKREREAQAVLAHMDLGKYFSRIFGGQVPDYSVKPSAEHMKFAMNEYNVEKHQCIMIGDMKSDMVGAKKAGCTAIGITWSLWSEEELYQYGADRVADSPGELGNILRELKFL